MTIEKLDEMRADWQCPECGLIVSHSYLAMTEVGNPVCDNCDEDMELRMYDEDEDNPIT